MSGANGSEPRTQEIVRVEPKQLSRRDPFKIAQAFAASNLFPGLTLEAAVVKIIAGEELGIGPMAAIKGLDVIEGELGFRGNLVATLVKQHPVYDYRVKEKTNERCEIEFGPAPVPGQDEAGKWKAWPDMYGASVFTVEDAKTAGLIKAKSNWEKYPRAMCFNRALTEGVRAYIPDVTAGNPAYTDDEIREVIAVDAEVEATTEANEALAPERVAHLIEGIEIVKPALEENAVNWLDGLNVILGSLGMDGLEPDRDLGEQLGALSAEGADQLDAELQSLADQQAERGEKEGVTG